MKNLSRITSIASVMNNIASTAAESTGWSDQVDLTECDSVLFVANLRSTAASTGTATLSVYGTNTSTADSTSYTAITGASVSIANSTTASAKPRFAARLRQVPLCLCEGEAGPRGEDRTQFTRGGPVRLPSFAVEHRRHADGRSDVVVHDGEPGRRYLPSGARALYRIARMHGDARRPPMTRDTNTAEATHETRSCGIVARHPKRTVENKADSCVFCRRAPGFGKWCLCSTCRAEIVERSRERRAAMTPDYCLGCFRERRSAPKAGQIFCPDCRRRFERGSIIETVRPDPGEML